MAMPELLRLREYEDDDALILLARRDGQEGAVSAVLDLMVQKQKENHAGEITFSEAWGAITLADLTAAGVYEVEYSETTYPANEYLGDYLDFDEDEDEEEAE